MTSAMLPYMLLFLLLSSQALGQQYQFRTLSIDQGLSQSDINHLLEDSRGYMWICTEAGLNRYNGDEVKQYTQQSDQVAIDAYQFAAEDPEGRIWFLGAQHIYVYHRGQFKDASWLLPEGSNYQAMYVDRYNRYWFLGSRHLSRWQDSTLQTWEVPQQGQINFQSPSSTKSPRVRVAVDSAGHFYALGTRGLLHVAQDSLSIRRPPAPFTDLYQRANGHILLASEDSIYRYTQRDLVGLVATGSQTLALTEDATGRLYYRAGMGVYRLDPGKQVPVELLSPQKQVSTNSIYPAAEAEGRLWLATNRGIYMQKPGGHWTQYGSKQGLRFAGINRVFADRQGNIWANGSYAVIILSPLPFLHLGEQQGLNNPYIFGITQGPDGSMYFGDSRSQVLRYDGGEVTYLLRNDKGNTVEMAMTNTAGQVYMMSGLPGVFHRFEPDGSMTDLTTNRPADIIFQADYDTSSEQMLLSLGAGTLLANDSTGLHFLLRQREVGNILSWATAGNGRYYVGSNKGLYYLQDDQLQEVAPERGMRYLPRKLIGTPKGVWVLQQGMIAFINLEGLVRVFDEEHGLAPVFFSMVQDLEGNIWVGATKGVYKIYAEDLYEEQELRYEFIGKEEGFIGVECSAGSAYCDQDGYLWFGNTKGVTRIPPKPELKPTSLPQLVLLGIQSNSNRADSSSYHGLDITDSTQVATIELPYYFNSIEFSFDTPHFGLSRKPLFQYYLQGFDQGWQSPGQAKQAGYNNLAPGTYQFRLRSAWKAEELKGAGLSVRVVIKEAYWQSIWFKVLLALSMIIATIALTSLVVRLSRKREMQRLALQKHVAETNLKALRAQMNPHFIFNALNSIQNFVLQHDGREANRYLTKFARLMRAILENSRDKLIALRKETDALELYLELESLRFDEGFSYSICINTDSSAELILIPGNLIQPFAENAIWHGLMPLSHQGALTITISNTKQHLQIVIEDNGIGRKAAFARKKAKATTHKSVGLDVIKERFETLTELYGHSVSLKITDLQENGKATGTRVSIQLPLLLN